MKRRSFLAKSTLGTFGAVIGASSLYAKPSQWFPEKKIITISYNVYQSKGYPETDDTKFILEDMRPQMADRFALELALYKPHIITFQEAPDEGEVEKVAKLMSMNYAYFNGGFPGAVLSKFEIMSFENCPLRSIKEPGDLFSRHWGKAILRSKRRGNSVVQHSYASQQ